MADDDVISNPDLRSSVDCTLLRVTVPYTNQFIFKHLNLYFQVQYVNALAESLLNYRDRTEALRLGFAIVR